VLNSINASTRDILIHVRTYFPINFTASSKIVATKTKLDYCPFLNDAIIFHPTTRTYIIIRTLFCWFCKNRIWNSYIIISYTLEHNYYVTSVYQTVFYVLMFGTLVFVSNTKLSSTVIWTCFQKYLFAVLNLNTRVFGYFKYFGQHTKKCITANWFVKECFKWCSSYMDQIKSFD